MPKKFESIFFDLDHTLWDFDYNSEITLKELCLDFEFHEKFSIFDESLFIERFNHVNHELWDLLNKDQISVDELRLKRINHAIEPFGMLDEDLSLLFNDKYLEKCPNQPNLMPKVFETLETLFEKGYKMHVLTNGFEHIQLTKLIAANIFHFFDHVVTFNDTGVRKPDLRFFEFALKASGNSPEECVMVGDNPIADLSGAKKLNIHTVWFNPERKQSHVEPDHEISCISEILHIV